jgi:ATP-binding cassette, subfamily B, bacterial PglK
VIRYLNEIVSILGKETRKLPFFALLFLGSSVLDLIGIGLIGPYLALMMDSDASNDTINRMVKLLGLPSEQRQLLVLLGLILIGLFVIKAIIGLSINKMVIKFSLNQQVRLRSRLMHAYQRLPYTEFIKINSSEYIYSIHQLSGQFANSVVRPALRLSGEAIVATAIFILLAVHNPVILLCLVILIITVIYGYDKFCRDKLCRFGELGNRANVKLVQGVNEGIEGLKEIRILGREDYFHRMVRDGAKDYARFHTPALVLGAVPRYMLEVIMVSFIVLLVVCTILLGNELNAIIPTLGMLGVAALRLLPSANSFSSGLVDLRYNRNAVSRLNRDISSIKTISVNIIDNSDIKIENKFKKLTLDRVCFTYPSAGQKALNDISIEIRSGESIGLIGPSGSGKTTLADVLLGLLEPQEGSIKCNGALLKELLPKWRAHFAYLPQEVFLIDNTLRHNIALGVEEDKIDDVLLDKAIRQAQLGETVEQLPNGVNAVLGERGIRLSGGQRQRVAIARAFYHQREVLVMDESTSALDNETELEIVQEILRLKGVKTIIAIAHRLSTLKHCDKIYRLDKGEIVAQGTYDKMIGRETL